MSSVEIARGLVQGLPSMKIVEVVRHLSIVTPEKEIIVLKDRDGGVAPNSEVVIIDSRETLDSYSNDYYSLHGKSVILHSELLNKTGQDALLAHKNRNASMGLSLPLELMLAVENLAIIRDNLVQVIKNRSEVFPINGATAISKEEFEKLSYKDVEGKTYLVNFDK